MRLTRLGLMALPTLALSTLALPTLALADACETVKSAYDTLTAAPAYKQTVAMEGMPEMQLVMIGDTMHMNAGDGKWMTMPLQPGMRAEMMKKTVPDATALKDCAELGEETLDGQPMTIIEYLPPAIEGLEQGKQKVWIGQTDNLPHQMTALQEGKPIKVTLSFENVTAPEQ